MEKLKSNFQEPESTSRNSKGNIAEKSVSMSEDDEVLSVIPRESTTLVDSRYQCFLSYDTI